MNIFFVIPYTPTRIRTRSYNLILQMLRRGHTVGLATLWENYGELGELLEWRNQGAKVIAQRLTKGSAWLNMLLALPSGSPLQASYCWQPYLGVEMGRVLNKRIKGSISWDVIHVEHLRGSGYGLYIKSWLKDKQLPPIPIVWDSVDCISLLFDKAAQSSRSMFGKWVSRLELPRTRKREPFLVSQFDHTLVTSDVDRQALIDLCKQYEGHIGPMDKRISTLTNGVDLDYFKPSDQERKPARIVLTGKMSYHANVTAALHLVDDIMPLVWAKKPETVVEVVGSSPTAQVRRLAARHPGNVIVTGYVDDLRPYLQHATLAAAPVAYGVGVQNKVLEAMACGAPVVSTPQSVSSLQIIPGKDLIVAEQPTDFAAGILTLLENESLRKSIGCSGRVYVEQNHDWGKIAGSLEELYQSLK